MQFSAGSDSVSNDDVYDSNHADQNARGLLCECKVACRSKRFLFLQVNTTAFSSDGSETEVKVQFHSQTQDNQQYAESETGETDNR